MNYYRDIHLDDSGVDLLEKIIGISQDDPIQALGLIDEMIAIYPESPQLWVSKSVIIPPNFALYRRECCKKAIDLDNFFYNGYYYLAKNQRLSGTVFCNYDSPAQLSEAIEPIMKWARWMQVDTEAGFDFLDKSPQLFTNDWDELYARSLSTQLFGLSCINQDRIRYTQGEVGNFTEQCQSYETENSVWQKFHIMNELTQALHIRLPGR